MKIKDLIINSYALNFLYSNGDKSLTESLFALQNNFKSSICKFIDA